MEKFKCHTEQSGYSRCSSQCEACQFGYTDKNINFENAQEDIINKPKHYHRGGIDVIAFLEQHYGNEKYTVAEGFAIGSIHKYVSRYKKKNGLQDLEKAEFYVNKLKEYENKG
jgi:hypothetical protein